MTILAFLPSIYNFLESWKQTFLDEQITSLYAVHSVGHVFSIGDAVSPLRRKHTLGDPWCGDLVTAITLSRILECSSSSDY